MAKEGEVLCRANADGLLLQPLWIVDLGHVPTPTVTQEGHHAVSRPELLGKKVR